MITKSNVTYDSNVYVINGDLRTDKTFQSKVRGRKNLKAMLIELAGLRWVKGDVSVDNYTHLLTEIQQKEWELGMYCALLGDRDEIVWGLIKEGDELKIACRCYKTDCRHFRTCRPDYEPGMELPALPEVQFKDNSIDVQIEKRTGVAESLEEQINLEIKPKVISNGQKADYKNIDGQEKGIYADYISKVEALLETKDKSKFQKLAGLMKELPAENDLGKLCNLLDSNEKAAILCRNIGEALKVSGKLWQRQIPHGLDIWKRIRIYPVWVADLLNGFRGEITVDDFINTGELRAEEIFSTLKLICGAKGDSLDCETVRVNVIINNRLSSEFFEENISHVVVCTEEQAKNKEFEYMYMLEPDAKNLQEEFEKEARIWCFALSKTKKEFKWFRKKSNPLIFLYMENGRWIEVGQEKNGRKILVSLEVGIDGDVDEESFVDGSFQGLDPYEVQIYIRNEVKPGDPLEIVLIDRPFPVYGIYHKGKLIGKMSDSFVLGVRKVLETNIKRFSHLPRRFSEVYVEKVYSVVRKPDAVSPYVVQPFMSTGIWHGVVLSGMGKVRFD
ncbi:hypothetical protein SAMN02745221_01881 [Thermosyntropha lipolytica DSM 11003]|uniref:Uncharacterized protein n=1 Tax=Thermosyntropha lipolytica DSM 11003 TaxID=1123382 RepID=A0A1M5QY46_9FIRM|nr:hypothetical protein [Thermosyntropha lipolytica]SHH18786.1 hypothetical protein SAMN02745221_01881 [Thermosyntropha lipolytica DSM 11003]